MNAPATFDEWAAHGETILAEMSPALWELGDWIVAGEVDWSDRYVEALMSLRFFHRTFLAHLGHVAAVFPPPRRRSGLTWKHHSSVVELETTAQDEWLDRATTESLSPNELRQPLGDRR